jgi:hypothetical protein
MKKFILISFAALLFITACKKAKTTAHLWVDVNIDNVMSSHFIPDSLHTIVGGSLVKPGSSYVINTASDYSSNRKVKVLDFGEVQPGTYQVDSIHGYAYGDSVYIILGALDTTQVFTLTQGVDQTLIVNFKP